MTLPPLGENDDCTALNDWLDKMHHRSGDGLSSTDRLHQEKVFTNLVYQVYALLRFAKVGGKNLTQLRSLFDSRLNMTIHGSDTGSWRESAQGDLSVCKDILYEFKAFTAEIVPVGFKELQHLRYWLCTIFSCTALASHAITKRVILRLRVCCMLYFCLCLDLIDFGIFSEDEMINLYWVTMTMIFARFFGNGEDGMVGSEMDASPQERWWSKMRQIATRYTLRGGMAARSADGSANFDFDAVLFQVFTRGDGLRVWEKERGRRDLGGNTKEAEAKKQSSRFLNVDTDLFVPKAMLAKGRCFERWRGDMEEVHDLKEGIDFQTHADGRVVYFANNAGESVIDEAKFDASLPACLSVVGATKMLKTLVVSTEAGANSDSKVFWDIVVGMRYRFGDGRIHRSPDKASRVVLSGAECQRMARLYYKADADGGMGVAQPTGISKWKAQAWVNELARLQSAHGWLESFEAEQATGLGASEWPLELRGDEEDFIDISLDEDEEEQEEQEEEEDVVTVAALPPLVELTQEAMWVQHGIASSDIESNSAAAQLTAVVAIAERAALVADDADFDEAGVRVRRASSRRNAGRPRTAFIPDLDNLAHQ